MTHYQLRAGVSVCLFSDCALVLDIEADRYWRVGTRTAALLAAVERGSAASGDEVILDRLVSLRLVVAESTHVCRHAVPVLPTACRSATEGARGSDRFSLRLTLSVAWWTLASRLSLRARPLTHLVDALDRRRRQRSRPPSGDLIDLAIAFQQHRRLVPLATRCLPDSLAVLAFLASRGHYPHLVFGVACSPFAAHCWVQHDDLVVNDAVDHAAVFKPILIA